MRGHHEAIPFAQGALLRAGRGSTERFYRNLGGRGIRRFSSHETNRVCEFTDVGWTYITRNLILASLLSSDQEPTMAKIICVLYDDPVDGYPKSYPRDDLPKIDHYPGGPTLPRRRRSILNRARCLAASQAS
jgi:hypothetical protein